MAATTRTKISKLIAEDNLAEADSLVTLELERVKISGNDSDKIAMLLSSADVSMAKLQAEKALKAAREAWPLAKRCDDNILQAEVLVCLVSGLTLKGSSQEALHAATTAMPAVRQADKPLLEAALLHSMAASHLNLGNADDALKAEEKAMDIYTTAKDKKGEAVSLTTIAKAQLRAAQFDAAIATARDACALWRSLGQAVGIVTAIETISKAQAAQGFPKASLAVAQEELSLFQARGADLKEETMLMERVALLAADLGEKIEAIRVMEDMVSTYKAAGDRVGEASKLLQSAEMHASMNHSQEAIRLAKLAQDLFVAAGDKNAEEDAKLLQTTVLAELGQHGQAPHRAESFDQLKLFLHTVEQRDCHLLKRYEAELERTSSAMSESEISTALESLFERDPGALQYLEEQGWELDTFKTPTRIYQYPHQSFYLATIAGGMIFGPSFRTVHPYRKDKPSDKDCCVLSSSYVPKTEYWQGQLGYHPGIVDSGLQSNWAYHFPPQ